MVERVGSAVQIADLWDSTDSQAWGDALERYWNLVQPSNRALERSLGALNPERLHHLDARGWYNFLKDEYFRWKFTAHNRYASTVRHLQRYVDGGALGELDQIRKLLLTLDTNYIRLGLTVACAIPGLGTAGASGLLALMYSEQFGTVDQFVVKALGNVNGLPEAVAIARMKPENLTVRDGVLIIGILRRKAADNNHAFKSSLWTPRKLDKVLWAYGHEPLS